VLDHIGHNQLRAAAEAARINQLAVGIAPHDLRRSRHYLQADHEDDEP